MEKKSETIAKFKDKRILIWGYGREGKSTEHFLKENCAPASIEVFEGKREEINEESYDYIFKSPGIVMEEEHPKYTSQTQVFLEAFADRTVGITGTKGKSTTSTMLYRVLRECTGRNVILLGNIGLPCLDYFNEITEDTVVVFEMSCHQLAHITVSPHVAVFLNLYEEHLDYYKTMAKYFAAKSNITKYQKENDRFYVGENVPAIETKAITTVLTGRDLTPYTLKILGEHNLFNANTVAKIALECFGAESEKIGESLASFEGLAHRLMCLGEKDGITYYDDSISTIPNATIAALSSVPKAQTVLIGGMDRGIGYDVLEDFIRAHSEYQYIFMYASGKRIYEAVGPAENRYYEDDLNAAVLRAKQVTEKGYACVLSPAAASYGYFKNFEERGDRFKELIYGEM